MTRTAGELARHLGMELEGDPGTPISGCAGHTQAGPQDLIYVDSPQYAAGAAASPARCAIAGLGVNLPGKTVLRTGSPKLAFAKAAAWLLSAPVIARGTHPTALIAPTAEIAPGAAIGPFAVIGDNVRVGKGTQIGPFCSLGEGAQLGEDCLLYPRVTVYARARLGNRVVVHAGAVIGSDGFGYVFGEGKQWKFPQCGAMEIGDDVEIGANTTLDRGSLGVTRVASDVKIDNLVQVAHNVAIGEHSVIAAQTGISGSSALGANVVVGGQVGIADHCCLEDGAVAGAQAGIPSGKTIRKGQVVWGTPARPLDRFKRQFAWFARLPELAERVRKLEADASRR